MTTRASQASGAFDLLDERVQHWIWQQRWPSLRPAQERAVAPILAADRDVVICAATAAGKTEAAFLPICTRLLTDRDMPSPSRTPDPDPGPPQAHLRAASDGVKVLYVSPLKALINDQWDRLDGLCEHLEIPVHRWHGDVNASHKSRALKTPDGILLITPESLEAMFVNRGTLIRPLLHRLRYVVIDEMHAFLGTQRGAQLQSQLHRIELATHRRIPRIALSATLGDTTEAQTYLRPTSPTSVHVIEDHGDGNELRMQLRGYERQRPDRSLTPGEGQQGGGEDDPPNVSAIATHLFDTLRGSTNLVFANRRADVEQYVDKLTGLCATRQVPNEFHPHHGSLSRTTREDVESLLRSGEKPTTVVCTSTLELGIDIGAVNSVAQLGAPPSVAALRQRLGRSGRRVGEPAVLRIYVSEDEIAEQSSPTDTIRPELVQTIAMVDLLFERWFEPVDSAELNLSTLIQQILSLIAQHGGVRPVDAFNALCGPGPFQAVTSTMFAHLLRDMGSHDLIIQGSDGLLLPGERGERLINHYSFYPAFWTPDEYRLIADGATIGSMPVTYPIEAGTRLIFSGKRWQVINVDDRQRVIELVRSSGGRPPKFTGAAARISGKVHHYMLRRYVSHDVPKCLDGGGQRLLTEGRDYFRRWRLHQQPLMRSGSDLLVFPWAGDRIHDTLALLLTRGGLTAVREGVAINIAGASARDVSGVLAAIACEPAPDPAELARGIQGRVNDKYDLYLGVDLLAAAYAARALDVPDAIATARRLLDVLPRDQAIATRPAPKPPAAFQVLHRAAPDDLHGPSLATVDAVFAVLDVETTGFTPALGDRIVEIGIVRMTGEGTILERFETLVNPNRSLSATSVHGIADADVINAPTFEDLAYDIATRLEGVVVAAHNAPFDLGFVSAEFSRLGLIEPITSSVCTLELAARFLPHLDGHKLPACAQAEGIPLDGHHRALADAQTTAALLATWLGRARDTGGTTLADLGILTPEEPAQANDSVADPTATLVPRHPQHASLPVESGAFAPVRSVGGQLFEFALSRALADGTVSDLERQHLDLLAAQWGLSAREQAEIWEATSERPHKPERDS